MLELGVRAGPRSSPGDAGGARTPWTGEGAENCPDRAAGCLWGARREEWNGTRDPGPWPLQPGPCYRHGGEGDLEQVKGNLVVGLPMSEGWSAVSVRNVPRTEVWSSGEGSWLDV